MKNALISTTVIPSAVPAHSVTLESVTLLTTEDSLGANLADERFDAYVRAMVDTIRDACQDETAPSRVMCDVLLRPGQGPHVLLSREGALSAVVGRRVWQALVALPAPSPAVEVVMFQLVVRVGRE
jgi:hypothetical protein